jgi:hypothetical protein
VKDNSDNVFATRMANPPATHTISKGPGLYCLLPFTGSHPGA